MFGDVEVVQERILGSNKRIHILNTSIDVLTMEQTVHLVERYIKEKEPLHLIGVNADKVNELNRNEYLLRIVNSCGVINADGASIVLASKFLGKPLPERVAGIDLMQNLVSLSAEKGYRVFLLGARQEVVEDTEKILCNRYPSLNVVGTHNGYFKKEYWHTLSDLIKATNPDLVFVGISSPAKEYLVEYLQSEGHVCAFMGVGGSFDVISGRIPRAPIWMQKINLEWLFRVIQEPKRLFKRYFVGNFVFIMAVIKEKMKRE